jgi:predicted acyltransferase
MSATGVSPPRAEVYPAAPRVSRLASLDQLRGYTMAGMFLVNFIAPYAAAPDLLRHHRTYCSYADTIMPHFLFAVGFALRLAHARRVEQVGPRAATARVLRRSLLLLLVGVAFYSLDDSPWRRLAHFDLVGWLGLMFQTLVHIAVTTVWVLPIIRARPAALAAFAAGCGLLHLGLSQAFYLDWTRAHTTIDGGLLGFLTWTIPTLAGAWACDLLSSRAPRAALPPLVVVGAALSLLGAALSLVGEASTLPFVDRPGVSYDDVDVWTMSLRSGSVTYQTFAAGLSLLAFAAFIVLCDLGGFTLGVLRTLGTNPLAGYLLHGVITTGVQALVPRDASFAVVFAGCAVAFALTWGALRVLEARGLYLRL